MRHFKLSQLALTLVVSASLLYGCGGIVAEEKVAGTGGDNITSTPDTGGGTGGAAKFTAQMQKLLAPDADINDAFGYAVAIDGDYAIAGSPYEGPGVYGSGAAYIFHRNPDTDSWDNGVKVVTPDAQADDQFGYSVAISGDYAIVGAWLKDGNGEETGAAYIFHRTGGNSWDSVIKIQAPDAQTRDHFGNSVSISRDYAIVGARSEDSMGDGAGAAYLFHRTGTNSWDDGTKITAADGSTSGFFGASVSIDGDYAVIGTPGADRDSSNLSLGAAYIFRRTGTNSWDDGTKIVAFDASPSKGFGATVSISGDYLIAGAPGAIMGAGAAYIFHRTDTNMWDTGTKIVAPDGEAQDVFGQYSISISGDYAIVGATYENTMGDGAGAAYIFQRDPDTDSWNGGTKILASDGQATDYFGRSVAISGDHAIVGASSNSEAASNAGAIYIFE